MAETILVRRLKQLLAEQRTDPTNVARGANLSEGNVRDILNGRSKSPRRRTLESIAKVLKTDVAYLLGEHDNRQSGGPPTTTLAPSQTSPQHRVATGIRLPVLGLAEAGSFRVASLVRPTERTLDVGDIIEDGFMGSFALELTGVRIDGADFAGPSFMICDPFAGTDDQTIHTGETYAIVRRIALADTRLGDHMTEIALRRARVFGDGIELTSILRCPQEARIIKVLPDLDGDQTKPVFVLGIARKLVIAPHVA